MKSTLSAVIWKTLERFGVQGVQFVLQIILARLLEPEHYGILSVMIIFINLANVFIQSGFNTALIQRKNVEEDEYSSVFWLSLFIAIVLYCLIFMISPMIARFYDMPDIIKPMRVLALVLFPGALNSIQIAKVSRSLDFHKVFISNIGGIIVAGVIGIFFALNDGGIWALVTYNLFNVFISCITMLLLIKWRPRFKFNFIKIRSLFSFGWKMLLSRLIDTLYQDMRSLVIGRKYSSATLAFYNRGKQFPQFLVGTIDEAVYTVMLPVLAVKQDQINEIKNMVRKSISVSSYIIMPMMAGFAACAVPFVEVVLTEKWLECVPYLRIYCLIYAFSPIHSCNLQAINALGRSDLFLKLEIVKKVYGVAILVVAVVCFDSPIAIAITGAISSFLNCIINSSPNKRLLQYSLVEQIKDILPPFVLSIFMGICVFGIQFLDLSSIAMLCIQVPLGISIYFITSKILRLEGFEYVMLTVKDLLMKRKKA